MNPLEEAIKEVIKHELINKTLRKNLGYGGVMSWADLKFKVPIELGEELITMSKDLNFKWGIRVRFRDVLLIKPYIVEVEYPDIAEDTVVLNNTVVIRVDHIDTFGKLPISSSIEYDVIDSRGFGGRIEKRRGAIKEGFEEYTI